MDNYTEFNLVEQMLLKAKRVIKNNRYFYIVGFEGDINTQQKPEKWYVADNNTAGKLYIYQNGVLYWKFIKKSNKGYFINSTEGRIYLDEFEEYKSKNK